MTIFGRLSLQRKLALFGGVPVLGALLLSLLIVSDAQQRARKAAGLGSIEDLARLTERMTLVIHDLQMERAELAYSAGLDDSTNPDVARHEHETDEALRSLSAFLDTRDQSKLPAKLARELTNARGRLAKLAERRTQSRQADMEIDEHLEFYSTVNDSLIAATAALTQLTDDGEVLLAISRLVGAMQVIERSSREHALLSYVFAKGEFPPGTFRYFVTLMTEQETYTASMRTFASDDEYHRFQTALRGPRAEAIETMRKAALQAEDSLQVPAHDWFEIESSNMADLFRVEQDLGDAVRAATTKKVIDTRHAVRLGFGLAGVVLVISLLLGWAVGKSLLRSVRVLSDAAETVHRKRDFTIRAQKTSNDELGLLTDAFNGMLSGIQERDAELRQHRENLEALVDARTRELSDRNMKMRLVLDNVAQGLVMIDRGGKVLGEYSRQFAQSFGAPHPGTPFNDAIASDERQAAELAMNYEQLVEDFLPIEVVIQQMPKALTRDDRKYALAFTPVMRDGTFDGALLMTRDITAEVAAQAAEAAQRQKLKIFERIMRDRSGFFEFLSEAHVILEKIAGNTFADRAEKLRAIHTLKGNSAIFDVASVAAAAHDLERSLIEGEDDGEHDGEALARLLAAWDEFIAQIEPICGEDSADRMEMTQAEWKELVSAVRANAPHQAILHSLVRLRHEPARMRFKRIEEQLAALAHKLGKADASVRMQSGDVRIPTERFRPFWSSLAHVVRNIADHGFQTEAERIEQGKPLRNQVELRVSSDPEALTLEIADDGRGIDWVLLAQKAEEKNLPHATREQLVAAMFADGISTASVVNEHSGRGVGMSAVLAACRALNATIRVESEPGHGTRFRFVFPSIENDSTEGSPSTAPHDSVRPSLYSSSRLRTSRSAPPTALASSASRSSREPAA
jgi:two-component system chemotaxis sensor kinase CheA